MSIAKGALRRWRVALALLLAVHALDHPVAIALESKAAGVTTEVPADKPASHKKGHRKKKRKHARSAAADAPKVERPPEPSVSSIPSPPSSPPKSAIGARETSAPDGMAGGRSSSPPADSEPVRPADPRAPADPPIALVLQSDARGAEQANAVQASCPPHCARDDRSKKFVGAEVDVNYRYIWRGLPLSRGPVAQPAAWVTLVGFTAAIWSNVLLQDEPPSQRVSSVVPSLSYAYQLASLRFEPGIALFWIRDDLPQVTTVEASGKISLTMGPIRLFTGHYFDVDRHPGAYFGTFGPRYEPTVGRMAFRIFADVGWATAAFNDAYWDIDQGALDLLEGGVLVKWDLSSVLYVAMHAEVSTVPGTALRRQIDEPTRANVGVAFGAEL